MIRRGHSRESTVVYLKARTVLRKQGGLVPDYTPRKTAGRPAKRSLPVLARPVPCVELGPKPAGCACGSGVRTCNLGNGETDGRKGAVRHRDQCQACDDYEPKA